MSKLKNRYIATHLLFKNRQEEVLKDKFKSEAKLDRMFIKVMQAQVHDSGHINVTDWYPVFDNNHGKLLLPLYFQPDSICHPTFQQSLLKNRKTSQIPSSLIEQNVCHSEQFVSSKSMVRRSMLTDIIQQETNTDNYNLSCKLHLHQD